MQKKINSLNIIRVVAIFCVVLVHSTELLYHGQLYLPGKNDRLIFTIGYTMGRIGVPLFFMSTGYLMLDRQYETIHLNSPNNFLKKYVLPLLIKSEIGLIILIGHDILLKGETFDLLRISKQLLFLEKLPGVQTWYIPVILGIYLFLPLIAYGFQRYSNKMIILTLIPIVFYQFILVDYNQLKITFEHPIIENQSTFEFMGYYGVYVLLGGLIKRKLFTFNSKNELIFIGFFSLVLLIVAQYLSFLEGYDYQVWYNSALLLVTTVVLFALLVQIKSQILYTPLKIIASTSFGVFWIHSIIQEYIVEYFYQSKSLEMGILYLSLLNFIVSVIIVAIMKKGLNFIYKNVIKQNNKIF